MFWTMAPVPSTRMHPESEQWQKALAKLTQVGQLAHITRATASRSSLHLCSNRRTGPRELKFSLAAPPSPELCLSVAPEPRAGLSPSVLSEAYTPTTTPGQISTQSSHNSNEACSQSSWPARHLLGGGGLQGPLPLGPLDT